MTRRPPAALMAAAATLLLLFAAPATAAEARDVLALGYSNATELAALRLALSVTVEIGRAFAEGREPEGKVTASAAPPDGVTPAMLGAAMGHVLAAASMHSEAMSTLGSPGRWP